MHDPRAGDDIWIAVEHLVCDVRILLSVVKKGHFHLFTTVQPSDPLYSMGFLAPIRPLFSCQMESVDRAGQQDYESVRLDWHQHMDTNVRNACTLLGGPVRLC